MSTLPKRFDSELTVVIDRDKLPPRAAPSVVPGPTIEQLADVARAFAESDIEEEPPTLDACPAPGCADCASCGGRHLVDCCECRAHTKACHGTCSSCGVCGGRHMVTRETLAAWMRANRPVPPPEAA